MNIFSIDLVDLNIFVKCLLEADYDELQVTNNKLLIVARHILFTHVNA